MFAGYMPLASQSPYPITVYVLANYRPHLGPWSCPWLWSTNVTAEIK